MNEFLINIAQQAGLDEAATAKGVGAFLSSVKSNLPEDAFSQLTSLIPEAENLLDNFQNLTREAAPSGSLTGVMGMAASLLGGNASKLGTVITLFAKAGFSPEMIKQFLPAVFQYLKANGGNELVQKIVSSIPEIAAILDDSGEDGLLGKVSQLFE